MATKKLAKELGLLRQRNKSSNGLKKSLVSNQTFSYLIVIDFESTCWREKNNYSQEIIEFPAVLLNTSTGEVESEFHSYVQPQEHPLLSEFCTELTGITQIQVEAGIPLHICLSRFSRWLQNLQLEKGVVFPNNQQRSSVPAASQKLCTFVTWSDWDLGVCLQYECKRKQLHKPDVLNSWIDLRSTYKLFYDRKPKGLNGALQDLGIQFAGREHSGLDDARNTAQLAARMMRDGCVMKITRSLLKAPAMVKPTFGNTAPADNKKLQSNTYQQENKPSSRIPPKGCQIKSCSDNVTNHLNTKESSSLVQESVQICQSLISPKTLLNGTTTPQWGRNRRSVSAEAVTNIPSSIMVNSPSSHSSNTSLVLCSTTVSCLSSLPQINQPFTSAAGLRHVEEEEGAELSVEIEDRCGSYDDVVLEGDGDDEEAERHLEVNYVSNFDTGCGMWEQLDNTHSPYAQVDNRETVSVQSNFKTPNVTRKQSIMSLSVNVSNHNGIRQNSTISEPKTVTLENKSNQQEAEFKTPLQVQAKSDSLKKRTITNAPLPFRQSCFIPEKTSTPNIAFARPRAFITQKHKENTKSSFTIFTDPGKPSTSSTYVSFCTPKNVLTSLSTNTTSSITNRSSVSMTTKRQGSITSPLCGCGRRAKRQVVSNGGPNQGRGFFCCPVRRSGSGGRIQKGCEFFKWESAVRRSSSVVSPALRSSVSLCQSNSTISCCPPQRSMIR